MCSSMNLRATSCVCASTQMCSTSTVSHQPRPSCYCCAGTHGSTWWNSLNIATGVHKEPRGATFLKHSEYWVHSANSGTALLYIQPAFNLCDATQKRRRKKRYHQLVLWLNLQHNWQWQWRVSPDGLWVSLQFSNYLNMHFQQFPVFREEQALNAKTDGIYALKVITAPPLLFV